MVVGGDIAIIALSSWSRSDFERDLEVEIWIDFEIDFRPGPELDNKTDIALYTCQIFFWTLNLIEENLTCWKLAVNWTDLMNFKLFIP